MKMTVHILTGLVLATALWQGTALGQEDRWERAIQAFEEMDAIHPPTPGGILFLGSSSIRMWNTDKSFPDLKVTNRGFGGSQISDSIQHFARLVTPYTPRTIVFYAGDNDIAGGKSAEKVLEDYKTFVAKVRAEFPKTRVIFVAIKPSILRWNLVAKMRAANSLVEEYTKSDTLLDYLDIDTPMLGEDGKPRKELFIADGLHLSAEGYDLWNALVRPYLDTR